MSIRWEDLDPEKYEDMVSVLINRLHPTAQRIDGKGGDEGRDVQIAFGQDGQITDAFQLKSFTGRMGSGRRAQVAASLKRAAALKPARWFLVVPIDPTPSEDRWFRQLVKSYSFPTSWHGKTWLDEKMSAFPDIRRYFLEGPEREAIRLFMELREEQSAIEGVSDIVDRLRTLSSRANEIDPYYRFEVSTGATARNSWPSDVALSVSYGNVREDVYPKYFGAAKDRPITINVKFVVDPNDNSVLDALDFGLPVTIPPRLVSNVYVDAPAGLGGNFSKGEFSLWPTNSEIDEPLILALDIGDGDRLMASLPIRLTQRTGGPRGTIVTGADSTGWLRAQLKIDLDALVLQATFSLNPQPAMPAALLPLFQWIRMAQPPHTIAFRWPGGTEVPNEIRTPLFDNGTLGDVVEALAYLQERSGIYWEMPFSMTNKEGQDILTAASLLRGEKIDYPWKSLNLGLDSWGPKLEQLLNGESHPIMMEHDSWIDLEGAKIPIGKIRTIIDSARLENPRAVRQALESGGVPHLRFVPGANDKAQRFVVP